MVASSEFDEFVDQYHQALDEFFGGNPEPSKMLYSHLEDASLANPFGPVATGWKQVAGSVRRPQRVRSRQPAARRELRHHRPLRRRRDCTGRCLRPPLSRPARPRGDRAVGRTALRNGAVPPKRPAAPRGARDSRQDQCAGDDSVLLPARATSEVPAVATRGVSPPSVHRSGTAARHRGTRHDRVSRSLPEGSTTTRVRQSGPAPRAHAPHRRPLDLLLCRKPLAHRREWQTAAQAIRVEELAARYRSEDVCALVYSSSACSACCAFQR